jgi:hypothetical protein
MNLVCSQRPRGSAHRPPSMLLMMHDAHGRMHGMQTMNGGDARHGQRIDGLGSEVAELRSRSSRRQLLDSRRR